MQRNTVILLSTAIPAAALAISESGMFALPDFICESITTISLSILLITLLDIVLMAFSRTRHKSDNQY